MNKKCYVCNSLLTEANKTVEHIILNAIGGRLKSAQLMCAGCNGKLGSSCDAVLAKQLQFIAGYLQVKRERGDIPTTKGAVAKDGTLYNLVDGITPTIAKPKFEITDVEGGKKYHIQVRNDDELKQQLSRVKKIYPHFDVEEGIKHAKQHNGPLNEPLQITQDVGGSEVFRSVAKTACNFYTLHDGDRSHIVDVVDFLLGERDNEFVCHFYPTNEIYHQERDEVLHLLHLQGNRDTGLVYCVVEFFSLNTYLVILSRNYTGPALSETYAYDVVNARTVDKEVHVAINPDFVVDLRPKEGERRAIKYRSSRVISIADELQKKMLLEIALRDLCTEFFGEDQNAAISLTPEKRDEFHKRFNELHRDYRAR